MKVEYSRYRKLIVSLILINVFTLSIAYADDSIFFNQWSTQGKKWYYHTIKESELKSMPSWNPYSVEPPLLNARALKIAKEYLSKNYPEIKAPVVRTIKLTQFLSPKYFKDKWFYVIEFWYNFPVECGAPDNIKIVVMLDGSVNKHLAMPEK